VVGSSGVSSFCASVFVDVENDCHAIRRELERLPRDGNSSTPLSKSATPVKSC